MLQRFRFLISAHRYDLIAVMNGAIIMVLEIVGARIIAPQFGSSIYVWTAVIGVILAAMSAGYWYGGRLADRAASDRGLSFILVLAAIVLMVSLVTRELSLAVAAELGSDIRLQALVAAILLFAPANFLMGMVSPYLAKLKITNLATAGSSVGALYAAGTAGSILGTFAAGYWLIALMGNRMLGWWLVVALLVASAVASWRVFIWQRLALTGAVVVLMMLPDFGRAASDTETLVYDGDSAYARLQVVDVASGARLLLTDNAGAQSGVFLDQPNKPAFGYIRRFLEAAEAGVSPQRVLLIGGGAYTLPHLILNRYPKARVDVVEIDPKLDELAERFFGFRPDPRVRIIHQDGRTFLNANRDQYDIIYMDAFSSLSPPFQLTTSEAVGRLARSTIPDGLVVVNLISAQVGAEAGFAEAEYATYHEHFGQVFVAPVVERVSLEYRQNLILVAGRQKDRVRPVAERLGALAVTQPGTGQILTDDFAPVEQLTAAR